MRARSALELHPELAQLWTLHYAARMGLQSIKYAHDAGPPLFVSPAIERLRNAISELLMAVEGYRDVVESHPPDGIRVTLPADWTEEQAEAVFMFLSDLAQRVWSANEALVEVVRTEAGASVRSQRDSTR